MNAPTSTSGSTAGAGTGGGVSNADRVDDALWRASDLRFAHAGATHDAIDGVTIDIPRGRLTAILGPNGAGKSTLLALLLGAQRARAGQVCFQGRDVATLPRAELARVIGVLPQGETFAFPITVRALVEMGRYPHLGPWQRSRPQDAAAVDAALVQCEVMGFADRGVSTLSGGERQRARLARALAQISSLDRPGVPHTGAALALDEPTAALDLSHEMTFFALVRRLADAGTTVLLVTHNLNLAARYADHVVLMHQGVIAAAGNANAVFTADTVSRVYGWPVAVVAYPGAGASHGAPQIVSLDKG